MRVLRAGNRRVSGLPSSFNVELGVPHVEVSHNEHVIRVLSEFGQAHEHTVEKAVFVILAGVPTSPECT